MLETSLTTQPKCNENLVFETVSSLKKCIEDAYEKGFEAGRQNVLIQTMELKELEQKKEEETRNKEWLPPSAIENNKVLIDRIRVSGTVSKEYIKNLDNVKHILTMRYKNCETAEELGLKEILLVPSSSISLFTPATPNGILDMLFIHPDNPILKDLPDTIKE